MFKTQIRDAEHSDVTTISVNGTGTSFSVPSSTTFSEHRDSIFRLSQRGFLDHIMNSGTSQRRYWKESYVARAHICGGCTFCVQRSMASNALVNFNSTNISCAKSVTYLVVYFCVYLSKWFVLIKFILFSLVERNLSFLYPTYLWAEFLNEFSCRISSIKTIFLLTELPIYFVFTSKTSSGL